MLQPPPEIAEPEEILKWCRDLWRSLTNPLYVAPRRVVQVLIEDGTNANTIKVTCSSVWESDAIAAEDNITKSGGSTYSLDATGSQLTIPGAELTGTPIAVLSSVFVLNATQKADIWSDTTISGSDILLTFTDNTGAAYDLTGSDIANGNIEINITYITE